MRRYHNLGLSTARDLVAVYCLYYALRGTLGRSYGAALVEYFVFIRLLSSALINAQT